MCIISFAPCARGRRWHLFKVPLTKNTRTLTRPYDDCAVLCDFAINILLAVRRAAATGGDMRQNIHKHTQLKTLSVVTDEHEFHVFFAPHIRETRTTASVKAQVTTLFIRGRSAATQHWLALAPSRCRCLYFSRKYARRPDNLARHIERRWQVAYAQRPSCRLRRIVLALCGRRCCAENRLRCTDPRVSLDSAECARLFCAAPTCFMLE